MREILHATTNREPESLAALAPDLSIGFVKVVELCLAKDPERRPKDADTLAALLLPFCAASDLTSAGSAATHQLSTVSLAVEGATRTDAAVSGAKVVAADWVEMEDLFKNVPGEVVALWKRYDGSDSDAWTITPDRDRGGPRVRQRFLNEARTAGSLVSRMPGNIPLPRPDLADTWMSAVKAVIDPMSDLQLSGQDERGQSSGGEIKDPVQASINACAHFATALRMRADPLKPAAPFASQGRSIQGGVVKADSKNHLPLSLVLDPKDTNCVRQSGLAYAIKVERNEEPRAKEVSVVLHSVLIDGHERPQPRGKRFSLLDTRTTEYVADVSPGVPRYFSLLNQIEHATYREQGEAAWRLHTEHSADVMHGKTLELGLVLQSDYRTEGVRLVFELAPGPRYLLVFVRAHRLEP